MKRHFDGNLVSLTKDLAAAREYLENMPDDTEWTLDSLDTLDGVRFEAMRLHDAVEAILDGMNGH